MDKAWPGSGQLRQATSTVVKHPTVLLPNPVAQMQEHFAQMPGAPWPMALASLLQAGAVVGMTSPEPRGWAAYAPRQYSARRLDYEKGVGVAFRSPSGSAVMPKGFRFAEYPDTYTGPVDTGDLADLVPQYRPGPATGVRVSTTTPSYKYQPRSDDYLGLAGPGYGEPYMAGKTARPVRLGASPYKQAELPLQSISPGVAAAGVRLENPTALLPQQLVELGLHPRVAFMSTPGTIVHHPIDAAQYQLGPLGRWHRLTGPGLDHLWDMGGP